MVITVSLCLLTNSEKTPPVVVEIDGNDAINIAVELTIDPKSGGMNGEIACAIDVVGTSIFNRN